MINCKVELKLKWTKYCALSATTNENESDSNNSNNASNIIFTIKDTKLYAPVVTSARDNRKLSKPLSKGFERWFIGMNIKQKVRKIKQMDLDIF